jgi:hypothetical protein
MRRYSYRYAEGRQLIFGGHFEFEIRGDYALVLLADHLIPLAASEIPTQIYRRFLPALKPSAVSFVEFDTAARRHHLVDLRWTETAGGYRFLGSTPLAETMVRALGLTSHWWTQAMESAIGTPLDAQSGSRASA